MNFLINKKLNMNHNIDLLIENEYHNIYYRYWKFMKKDYIPC